MTTLDYVWVCEGRRKTMLFTNIDFTSYRKSVDGAKAACEMHAQTSGNGESTWHNETEDFAQAHCERTEQWDYQITKEVIYP